MEPSFYLGVNMLRTTVDCQMIWKVYYTRRVAHFESEAAIEM